jgi:hypothetical protein
LFTLKRDPTARELVWGISHTFTNLIDHPAAKIVSFIRPELQLTHQVLRPLTSLLIQLCKSKSLPFLAYQRAFKPFVSTVSMKTSIRPI